MKTIRSVIKPETGRILSLILCVLCLTGCFSVVSFADTGPKPSVIVTFKNLEDTKCFGTLLSENASTGPFSAWDGTGEGRFGTVDPAVWQAFVDYEDTDGYFYLQNSFNVGEEKAISWTYYPPERFKILLYFPEYNSYAVSGVLNKYAFDSYFTVDMKGVDVSASYTGAGSAARISAVKKSYPWTKELLSLLARIVITIAIEIGVALLFRLKEKPVLKFIVIANLITQVILNVSLNIINYREGAFMLIIAYFLLELFVFVIEAALYAARLNRYSAKHHSPWFCIAYAFAANLASFFAGLALAIIVPFIF